ncbi:FAD dependent oxidoreductase [Lentinula novae-zelandiae]|nr:FAD dependent oxidoreductase [Lentinula novae-zelandiae]
MDPVTQHRISQSPGIPRPSPTRSYWAVPPSNISQWGAQDVLPEKADIVIIGSGITGASIARTLLRELGENSSDVRIVMLEAREVCSGATARNGGHITPAWYHQYPELVKTYGKETAHEMIKFQVSHVHKLLSVAEEDGLLEDSQCRLTDSFDAYVDRTRFEIARENYTEYRKEEELSSLHQVTRLYEDKEQLQALQLSSSFSGVIGTVFGTMHAYRFVTGILSRLLKSHTANFQIFAETPCISITAASSTYVIETPKGTIRSAHIVHATNAWTSHLLPGFRRKIVPLRGEMTSQRPGTCLGFGQIPPSLSTSPSSSSNWQGSRTFIFYTGGKDGIFDYLTQQMQPCKVSSASKYPLPRTELMFGGGLAFNPELFCAQLGNTDDTQSIPELSKYLSSVLPCYFGENWGDDAESSEEDDRLNWGKGRTKASWSGLIGLSADSNPWVGRVPASLAEGRKLEVDKSRAGLADAGEWVCGGYSGEGMVNAWKCGAALAHMILGRGECPEWLPEPYTVSLERHAKSKLEDVLQSYI